MPVGGGEAQPVDVRIVSATHADLSAAVRDGRFRHDLFFRLNVYPIHLPPLRDRVDDIPALAEHFLRQFGVANPAGVLPADTLGVPEVAAVAGERARTAQRPGTRGDRGPRRPAAARALPRTRRGHRPGRRSPSGCSRWSPNGSASALATRERRARRPVPAAARHGRAGAAR